MDIQAGQQISGFQTWDDVVNEIYYGGRPFVLSMWHGGTGSSHTKPYGDHSMCGVFIVVQMRRYMGHLSTFTCIWWLVVCSIYM